MNFQLFTPHRHLQHEPQRGARLVHLGPSCLPWGFILGHLWEPLELPCPTPSSTLHCLSEPDNLHPKTLREKTSRKRREPPTEHSGWPILFRGWAIFAIWGYLGPSGAHCATPWGHHGSSCVSNLHPWGFKLTSLSTLPVFLLEFILYHLGIHMEVMGLVLGHILKQNFTSCLASGWPTQAKIL